MPDIVETDQVFEFMTITPTPAQEDAMEIVRAGVVSDIKKYCRWCITEREFEEYLPQHGAGHQQPLRTAEIRPVSRGQCRLQLPQMWIREISEVREDPDMAFGDETVLTDQTDYRLELREGIGRSGGLLRIGTTWPNVPQSIKISFTAGFTESDLSEDHNGLRFRAIKECMNRWFTRQQEIAVYVNGLSGDTSGMVIEEELGDWRIKYGNVLKNTLSQDGLSEDCKTYLLENEYVFKAVGF